MNCIILLFSYYHTLRLLDYIFFTNRFEINNLKFQYFKYLYMNNSIFNTKSAQKEKVEAYQNILNE